MSGWLDNIWGKTRGKITLFTWFGLATIVVAATMQAGFVPFTGPCDGDDITRGVPGATFDVTDDVDAQVTTVSHTGGDRLGGEHARSAYLRFYDVGTDQTTAVTWAGGDGRSFPVTTGDSMTIAWNETADWVDADDRVRVVYRSYDSELPRTCPNNRPINQTMEA
ncbi:hypothetical protein BRD04_00560 [Halobacteriales archaeon QS_9_67_17]|nr:MAG: hypothetical protein BRD04_00560 [Halobacteriales archaeon QS_9_67_17]